MSQKCRPVRQQQQQQESGEDKAKKKMDPTERLTESLIDSAWVGQAAELFADEVHDLELLEEGEEKLFQTELQRACEALSESVLDAASVDASQASQEKKDVKKAKKQVGASSRRGNVDKLAASVTLSGDTRTTNNSLRMKKEREIALLRARDQEFWYRSLQCMKQYIHQVREETDMQRHNVLQQQRFFSARGIDDYTMDEVLEGATNTTSQIRSSVIDGTNEEAQHDDTHLDEALSTALSSDTFVPGTTTVLTSLSRTEAPVSRCEFIIDAIAFASSLNAALAKEYGFRSIISIPRGPTERTSMDSSALRSKLLAHAPGDIMNIGEGWHSALPPIAPDERVISRYLCPVSIAADENTRTLLPPISCRDDGELAAPLVSAVPVSPKPSVSEGRAKTSVTSRSTVHSDTAGAKASSKFTYIECSAKDNSISLRTTAGIGVSRIIRFINRDPNLLRLRIRPSKHAWITYSMVKSSLDPPVSLSLPSLSSSSSPPSSLLRLSSPPASPSLTLSKPLVCGGFVDVQIKFQPQNTTEPLIREVLHLLHIRDLNSRRGEGAQWRSFDVKVECRTVLPQFRLIPIKEEGATEENLAASVTCIKKRSNLFKEVDQVVTKCEFPYTYVMDRCTRELYLENSGSDAVITLSSSSPCFQINPSPESSFLLCTGGRIKIDVCFAPMQEMHYDAEELIVNVQGAEEGCGVAEHRFGLCGRGILPHVELVSIGGQELSAPQQGARVPQYIIPSTAPGVETEVLVTVHNSTFIAVPFFWRTDTVGGVDDNIYSGGVNLRVTPVSGIFSPHENKTFSVRVKPTLAQPFAAVLNLFLEGLPAPSSEETALGLYSRSRPIPALPGNDELQHLSDPYNVFQHCSRPQPENCCGVFATGFYLFADPVMPSLVIIPDRLEEVVECLVHYKNTRRIVLQNNSPRPLHFCFDPKFDECLAEMMVSVASEREDVEVEFEPRKGCVPPHASVSVTVFFVVRSVGFHAVFIDCYIPELMELVKPFLSDKEASLHFSRKLYLSVTGVGPSVRVSTDCLDFGLIELGGEARVSFTVTNDNPIPVVFNLQDPMKRDPQRFVFLPQSFLLGAGESVEVTVYRQAVEAGDSQTFFELVVQGGSTLAIETRATIQAPVLLLEESVVNFDVVPEDAWVEQSFVLSNTSAFDITYTVQPFVLPSFIRVFTPTSGVVHAGEEGIHVPVRCAFGTQSGGDDDGIAGCGAILLIKNTRSSQEIFVELRCERVQRLSVTLDLIPVPKMTESASAMAYAPPQLPDILPPPLVMEVSCFIEALLWNLIELKVLCSGTQHENGHRVTGGGDNIVFTTSVDVAEESQIVLRPYCPPVVLKAFLPDREPVWSELVGLRIGNRTGCESFYNVAALHYSLRDLVDVVSGIDTEGSIVPSATTATSSSAQISLSGSSSTKNKGCRQKKQKQKQKQSQKQKQGCSSLSAAGRGTGICTNSTRVFQQSFWCTGQDGTELRERERRAALVGVQKILLDGRGCATVFGNSLVGSLYPHAEQGVAVSILANFPGRYEEILQVSCGGLPPTRIPLTLELSGKPVLLDSNTAGLAVLGGRELMLMPAVIAGVGRSRRTLSLVNRVPRDLNVSVNIFLTSSTFSVVAVDGDVNASDVTLQLQRVSEEEQQRESEGRGKVLAFPESFLLPAMTSREVSIEYAPDAFFVSGDGISEREWRGGVIITAEVANTSFNDGFLIDQFYRIHAARYPAERTKKTRWVRESEPAWEKSIVRPIAMLKVKPKLVSRPGVVKNNVILQPTSGELALLSEQLGTTGMARSYFSTGDDCRTHSRELSLNREKGDGWNESSDDDDDGDGCDVAIAGSSGVPKTYINSQGNTLKKSEEVILAQDEERRELCAFIERRRAELAEQGRRYFVPIELELRARCGKAWLSVEPSADVVHFPQYVEGELCEQVIQLTNESCAAMEFILDVPFPSFRIVSTRLVSMSSEIDSLEVNDEETARLRRAMEDLKWISREEQQKARRLMTLGKQKQTNVNTSMEVTMASLSGFNKKGILHSDTEFVTVTKYRLRPHDVLEVLLEYCKPPRAEVDTIMKSGNKVEAALEIMYLPISSSISDRQQQEGGTVKFLSPPPVLELTQVVPLVVTFASPSVVCRPSRLWFRPGQLLHDGRPQPSYSQKLQLVSSYPSAVSFRIVSSTQTSTGAVMTDVRVSGSSGVNEVGNCRESSTQQSSWLITREHQIRELASYWKDGGSDADSLDDTDAVSSAVEGLSAEMGKPEQIQLEELWRQQRRRQQQLQKQRQKQEEKLFIVEDPDRFTITPMEGVIPAATRGGQPGVFEISVKFKEHVNVRFEAAFEVLINDCVDQTCGFTLCGDSRETEL